MSVSRICTLAFFLFLSFMTNAVADVSIFNCSFKEFSSFVITSYEENHTARIGIEQGVGNKAQSFYDSVTDSWTFIEYFDNGTLPLSIITILNNGKAWISRHSVIVSSEVYAFQNEGFCKHRLIK